MSDVHVPVASGALVAGKYRIGPVLGAGGMGVVVSAWHERLQRRVALKFMRAERTGRDGARRFLREAQAASRLESEHVVRVLDVAELDDGTPYIVMEHLDGCDVAALAARRRPSPTEAAAIVAQACAGVAEAHAAGIIHRDLKPQNLFVARDRAGGVTVKVLDFGVSKLADPAAPEATGTDVVMGSPLYMAPEQMRSSRDVGAAADVWSLATILYELCAGAAPFAAASAPEVYARVLNETAKPLADAAPDVPAELAAVVDRCLARDPAARLPDAAALRDALRTHAADDLKGLSEALAAEAAAVEARLGLASTIGSDGSSAPRRRLAPRAPDAYAPTEASDPGDAPAGRGLWWVALAIVVAVVGIVVLARTLGRDAAPRSAAPPPIDAAVDAAPMPSDARARGERALAANDWNGAIAAFVECGAISTDLACLRGHGNALLGAGRFRDGAAKLEELLARDPTSPDRARVIDQITAALAAEPPAPTGRPPEIMGKATGVYRLAKDAHDRRDYAAAIPRWIDAWATTSYPQFLYNAGASYREMGDGRRAILLIERYIAWETNVDDITRALGLIEKIQGELGE